jgi:hypothetical protein
MCACGLLQRGRRIRMFPSVHHLPEGIGASDAAYGELWQQPPLQEQEQESSSDHANSRRRIRKRQQRILRLRYLTG